MCIWLWQDQDPKHKMSVKSDGFGVHLMFFFLIDLLCENRPKTVRGVLCTCTALSVAIHAVSTEGSLIIEY